MNAVIGKMVRRVVVVVAALEERLGGYATHVEAGAAEATAHFDAGRFQAQLTGFDGGDVASGAAAC